ncbi:MAG TPA: MmgE/PrpD family protein [Roseiarcus sp.]|nr:MmgE/PrpD family protein [Roseiarcus sp.]
MPHFPEQTLAEFAAGLSFDAIPAPVVTRCQELMLDWFGSALAGKGMGPVAIMERFASAMGPVEGPSEVIVNRRTTSPLFAAMVNAASSHVAEQDDLHNSSVFHPAAVVFPPALAVAQAVGASGSELLTACLVGYEVGIRVGEYLGQAHYKVFHTTGTAGSIAAAAVVGRLLRLSPDEMLDAFGSAGTQAAGLWEFLRDAADSKPLHTAHASATGLASAYLAKDGFRGARRILTGTQAMAAGMSKDTDPARITDRLGERWALAETSFKFHASCRHTHPAADALMRVMQEGGLKPDDVARVTAQVHQAAIDVLGPAADPRTVHQAKFSMGSVLALAATRKSAGMFDFERFFQAPQTKDFARKVSMVFDPEVQAAYPQRWIGKVEVETVDGRRLTGRVDEPKGDPGNTLSRAELEAKARGLAEFSHSATPDEMTRWFLLFSTLATASQPPRFFGPEDVSTH